MERQLPLELQKKDEYDEESLHSGWSTGKSVKYGGKAHTVRKMNSGDYFLTPKRGYKYGGAPETQLHFDRKEGGKKIYRNKIGDVESKLKKLKSDVHDYYHPK